MVLSSHRIKRYHSLHLKHHQWQPVFLLRLPYNRFITSTKILHRSSLHRIHRLLKPTLGYRLPHTLSKMLHSHSRIKRLHYYLMHLIPYYQQSKSNAQHHLLQESKSPSGIKRPNHRSPHLIHHHQQPAARHRPPHNLPSPPYTSCVEPK